MNCEKCQKEVFLPFKCQYCGGYFCSEHRLPENHECPSMGLARLPKEEATTGFGKKQGSYEYRVIYGPSVRPRTRIRFSNKEVGHLAIAALLVIAVGLSLYLYYFPSQFSEEYSLLAMFITILTLSFFAHEMAHKVVAQRRGLWAEFRLIPIGAVLTLLSAVSPIFKIISPGAVFISGSSDAKTVGKISIAGSFTNILLALAFLGIISVVTKGAPIYFLLVLTSAFNAWIATFNLIPFAMLDGLKVFSWNKKIWALAFTSSLVLSVISYELLF
jgi:Zn-dependent protease